MNNCVAALVLLFSFSILSANHAHAQSEAKPAESENNPAKSYFASTDTAATASTAGGRFAEDKRLRAIALNNDGAALARRGEYADAAAKLQHAIDVDPALISAYVNLSVVYEHLDRHDDALIAAMQAMAIDPGHRSARLQACQELLALDRSAESVKCFEGVGVSAATEQKVLNSYGAALLAAGEYAKALELFKKAVQTRPQDAELYTALGFAQYRRKKYDDALSSFERSLQLNPGLDRARFNLAVTLLAKNRRPEALQCYKQLQASNSELASDLYALLYKDDILVAGKKR